MQPNTHIQNLTPYSPAAHKIWNLAQENVLKLDWNESAMPPSPAVFAALREFLDSSRLHWYPNTQNLALLESIRAYTNQPSIDFIALFGGSDVAHECILDVFLQEGDTLGIITPTYDNLRARAQGVGIKTLHFMLEKDFNLDFTKLRDFLARNPIKMLYICSPNNPSGISYPQEALLEIIKDFPRILFLVDEAYCEFSSQTLESHTKIPNLIITRTFSKAFGLASFRIGYVLSHSENINALNKLRNAKNITMPSQIAALAALNDITYTKNYIKEVILARAEFAKTLESMGLKIYPSEANFILIYAPFVKELIAFLESRHIFIRDYSHIIAHHCRISIGIKAQMQIVAKAIKDFLRIHNADK